jgi:hypothetical protein
MEKLENIEKIGMKIASSHNPATTQKKSLLHLGFCPFKIGFSPYKHEVFFF